MNMKLKTTAQGGFTLIELIVVIVILGILAATALPKFASLGGDARVATLNAARGSLNSVVAMAHGKFLVNGASSVSFEGTSVNLVNGYPDGTANTATAAGLDTTSDFAVFPSGTAVTTASVASGPIRTATQMAVVPKAVAASLTGVSNCYILYTQATSTSSPPTTTVASTATADNCQ